MISAEDNIIITMDVGALSGLAMLQVLLLKRCQLRQMPPVVDTVKYTLEVLNLHGNRISTIGPDYFEGFVTLTLLQLSGNQLKTIPDLGPLSGTLIHLSFISNCITDISHSLYANTFAALTSIKLADNLIANVPCCVFSKWPSLAEFDISYNYLHSFPFPEFLVFNARKDVFMRLGFNRWRCDSALAWLAELDIGEVVRMGSTRRYSRSGFVWFLDYDIIRCAGPPRHARIRLLKLSKFKVICTTLCATHKRFREVAILPMVFSRWNLCSIFCAGS